jgi:selenocysteine lyase/cysteine desulfurase
VATRIGLGVAVENALTLGLDEIAARTSGLAAQLREMLGAIAGVEVHDKGIDRCGIVTFTVGGRAAPEVRDELKSRKINTTVTTVTSAQYDFPARDLTELVRASPHYYNTEDELAQLVDVVSELV